MTVFLKSRPVVGASSGITTNLGDLIADILEAVAKTDQSTKEAQSTEEILNLIDRTSAKIKAEG